MPVLPSERVLKREQGQDLVELALLLPLLLIIMVIVLDMGRAFNTYMVLTNAAREGARQGSMTPSQVATITEAALRVTRNAGIPDGQVAVSVTSAGSGNPVRVTVQYNFSLFTGLLSFSQLSMSAAAEMVAF